MTANLMLRMTTTGDRSESESEIYLGKGLKVAMGIFGNKKHKIYWFKKMISHCRKYWRLTFKKKVVPLTLRLIQKQSNTETQI